MEDTAAEIVAPAAAPNKKRLYPKFSLTLHGERWKVYHVDAAQAKILSMDDALGVTNRRGRRIYLIGQQTIAQLADTLCHEILHCSIGMTTACIIESKMDISEVEELFAEGMGAIGLELLQQGVYILSELNKLAVEEEDTVEVHQKELGCDE